MMYSFGNKPIEEKTLKESPEKCVKHLQPKWMSTRYVNTLAWLLLIMGLCIIILTLIFTIKESNLSNSPTYYDVEYPHNDKHDKDNEADAMRDFQESSERRMDHSPEFSGCEEHYCKVGCVHASNVYESLSEVLNNTQCQSLDFIAIEESEFPHTHLKNLCRGEHLTVREVFLRSCDIKRIRTDTFNTPLFAKTIYMMWYNLHLQKVDSGALLGLLSLRYLVIDTGLLALDRSFFQPVQTTLRFLKINAGMHLYKQTNMFGISMMENLEYVDLSNNIMHGTLTKRHFLSTPNLRYLIMTNSQVTSIESGAFDSLIGKLQMINLSLNFITVLEADVIEPLLAGHPNTFINLSMNSWHCYCILEPFARLYIKYRNQFLDTIYCKAPHSVYGNSIVDIDFENCTSPAGTVTLAPIEGVEQSKSTELSTTAMTSSIEDGGTLIKESKETVENDDEDVSVFQMRCLNPDTKNLFQLDPSNSPFVDDTTTLSNTFVWDSIESVVTTDGSVISPRMLTKSYKEPIECLEFEPPAFDFTVNILTNDSVVVTIADFKPLDPINVIWFSEQNFINTNIGLNFEHNCMRYSLPHLILDGFTKNTTYTFCLMYNNEQTVTPFNCLPLYVPPVRKETAWLLADSKPLTIGMLCLIFALSAVLGALIAYFGIKSYPDLLEGSKNILVVNQSDQNDYVSTMSETDYLKSASFKKKSMKRTLSLRSCIPNKQQPLPRDSPSPSQGTLPPFCISSKSLERLSSVKSSSTCFEDPPTFFPPFPMTEEEYVLPKDLDINYMSMSVNACAPDHNCSCMPPPLPKRNSSNAEGLNLTTNRFN